jgi:hypothetical protein
MSVAARTSGGERGEAHMGADVWVERVEGPSRLGSSNERPGCTGGRVHRSLTWKVPAGS